MTERHSAILRPAALERSRPAWVEGRRFLIQYDGDNLWHERLIVRRLTGQEFIIGSPDLDVYTEILPSDGPDVVYLQPEGGGRPSGVPRDDELYTFATPPSGQEKAEMEEAVEHHGST